MRCRIERLGHQGDGVAEIDGRPVYIPYALPGETVKADVAGGRGALVSVVEPAAERVQPHCPAFGDCGGCAAQHLAEDAYRDWKRGIVAAALRNRSIDAPVATLIDAHGAGRRRLTLHAKPAKGGFAVGFNARRGDRIVALDGCPLLTPELAGAMDLGREIARCLANQSHGALDIRMTATETGVDCDVAGAGEPTLAQREALAGIAEARDLARLTLAGEPLAERRRPEIVIGCARLTPPPGGFLQATRDGERVLSERVAGALPAAGPLADLFSGVGPFALRLAGREAVDAFDSDAGALDALDRAARHAPGLKPLRATRRDLFAQPLMADELAIYAGVVFDPPRAGAEAQARELAASAVPVAVGVSCDPASFARDAAILIDGGYALDSVIPIDQFRHAAHVEIVGVFRRPS